MSQWRRFFVLSMVSASLCTAQLNRATVTGIVTDPAGALVPGVNVTAVHLDTGTSAATVSTQAGAYTLPALQIGTYRVEYEAMGFKKAIRDQVALSAGATVRLDVGLEIGSVGESVTVVGDAVAIETETSRVSTTINTTLVQNIPLQVNGGIRSVLTLAQIAPEVRSTGGLRIGGGQAAGWEMMMDGLPLSSASSSYQTGRAQLSSVPIDAINEFTVETAGMKAESGRAMGSLGFVTKSGSNAIHGNLFEYLRNNALDANGFFNNAENRQRAILKQHDFGGTVGGPINIPKVYDGRNKSFFFASYQGFRNRAGSAAQFLTIPTEANYNGDFSTWTRNGRFVQIYDPATTRPGTGSSFIRTPFAGNIIPANRFSEVAKRIVGLVPSDMRPNVNRCLLATNPATCDVNSQNFVRSTGTVVDPWNKGSLRLDHQLNDSNRFSFLWLKGQWETLPGADGPPGIPIPFNGFATQTRTNQSGRLAWDHIRGTLTNTMRASNQLERGVGVMLSAANPEDRWNEKIGILNTPGPDRAFPQLSFTGYNGWGGAFWGGDAGGNFNFTDDLTLIKGNHTIKTGFFFARDRWDGYGQHRPNGSFGFNVQGTSIPNDNSQNTGNGFASFLLGYATSAGLETPRLVRQIYKYFGGYIQDDWKVTSRLTLNIGLRYEYTLPIQGGAFIGLSSWEDEASGDVDGFSNFDPTAPNPGAGGRLGAVVFSGKGPDRFQGTMFDGWPYAFGPRLSVNYRLTNDTVIRASLGRTFGAVKTSGGSTHFEGFILNRTYTTADNSVNDFPARLDTGLPAWPQPPFVDPAINNNLSVHFWQRSDSGRPPDYWNYNLDIQHQLNSTMVLTIGYTGTKGTYLPSSITRLNQVDYRNLQLYGRDLLNSNINSAAARAAGIPYPYAGFNSTVQRALTPYPQYLNVLTNGGQPASVGERAGNSTYHSMTLKLDKRYSNGLTVLGSYVLSKQFANTETAAIGGGGPMDHFNQQLEKALANTDQTHLYRASFSYDLPFGGNRTFNLGTIGNALAGGWALSGTLSYESGFPTNVSHNFNPINTTSRPFVNSYDDWRAPISGDKFDPYKDVWLDITKFNRNADGTPIPTATLQTVFGNMTRNNPKLRQPWNMNESFGLARSFNFTESTKFTLRFETFNAFNRVRWGNPNSAITGANFGQIRTQGNAPRRAQIAFRLDF